MSRPVLATVTLTAGAVTTLGAIARAGGTVVVVPVVVGAVAVAPAAVEFAAAAAARLEVVVERGVTAILKGAVVAVARCSVVVAVDNRWY